MTIVKRHMASVASRSLSFAIACKLGTSSASTGWFMTSVKYWLISLYIRLRELKRRTQLSGLCADECDAPKYSGSLKKHNLVRNSLEDPTYIFHTTKHDDLHGLEHCKQGCTIVEVRHGDNLPIRLKGR